MITAKSALVFVLMVVLCLSLLWTLPSSSSYNNMLATSDG